MNDPRITASRYHDISCGHRVVGHENKCALLHGHNYRIHFTCSAPQRDALGRVIDFGEMKSKLCEWVERNWDHRFIAWTSDPIMRTLSTIGIAPLSEDDQYLMRKSMVWVPFNPTAENMADYLLRVVGPKELQGTGIELVSVRIEETRKCSAEASL